MLQAVLQATPHLRGTDVLVASSPTLFAVVAAWVDLAPDRRAVRVRGPGPLAGDLRRPGCHPEPRRHPGPGAPRALPLPAQRRRGDGDARLCHRHRAARDRPREAPRRPERRRSRSVPAGAAGERPARPPRARRRAGGALLRRPRHQPRALAGPGRRGAPAGGSPLPLPLRRRGRGEGSPGGQGPLARPRQRDVPGRRTPRGSARSLPHGRRRPRAAACGAALPLLHSLEDVRDPRVREADPRVARGRGGGDSPRLGRRSRGAARGRGRARGSAREACRRSGACGPSSPRTAAGTSPSTTIGASWRPGTSRCSRPSFGPPRPGRYNHPPSRNPSGRQIPRQGAPRRGSPTELHEGRARDARDGRARGALRAAPRPHRAALRRGDVAGLLRRARDRRPGRQPGGGLGQPRGADRRDPPALRAGPPGLPSRLAGGRGRRELDDGGDARGLEARRPDGARRGGAALLRPRHAGGDQPARDRRPGRPAPHAEPRRRREPAPGRRPRVPHPPGRERHDRHPVAEPRAGARAADAAAARGRAPALRLRDAPPPVERRRARLARGDRRLPRRRCRTARRSSSPSTRGPASGSRTSRSSRHSPPGAE